MAKSPRAMLIESNIELEQLHREFEEVSQMKHIPRADSSAEREISAKTRSDCAIDCPTCERIWKFNQRTSDVSARRGAALSANAEVTIAKSPSRATETRTQLANVRRMWLANKIEILDFDRDDVENSLADRKSLFVLYSSKFRKTRKTFERDLKALGYRIG